MTKKQIISGALVIVLAIIGSEILEHYNPSLYNTLMFINLIIIGLGIITGILIYFVKQIIKNNREFKIDSGISERNKRYFKKINKERNKNDKNGKGISW